MVNDGVAPGSETSDSQATEDTCLVNDSSSTSSTQQAVTPPSASPAYLLYVLVALFYTTCAINILFIAESITYNKVCFNHYADLALCTNKTFTGNHPDLQLFMTAYSYVTAITTEKNRAFAMSMLEGSTQLGILTGTLISGPIADHLGLDKLAYISTGVSLLPLGLVLLFIKEIPKQTTDNMTWRDLLGVNHMLDAFTCVFKPRPNKRRQLIHLGFFVTVSANVAIGGYDTVSFLYINKELGLSLSEFSLFTGFIMGLKGFGGPVILGLGRRFTRLDRLTIAILSCGFLALGYLIIPITAIPHSLWFGGCLLIFQTVVYAVVRSIQAQLVDDGERGKLFAYDAILQVVIALLTNILYKEIYSMTLSIWSGIVFVLSAILYFLAMLVLIAMSWMKYSITGVLSETRGFVT